MKAKTILLQLGLFALTVFTTMMAGASNVQTGELPLLVISEQGLEGINWDAFYKGWPYALSFLGILTVHEFGHYFTALHHRVRSSLPYYIPMWLPFGFTLGTFGAVIRIKEPIVSRKVFFDVGIAGPLAGFVVALGVIVYGFTHLPPADYVLDIHPEYRQMEGFEQHGTNYEAYAYDSLIESSEELGGMLSFGTNLLFEICKLTLVPEDQLDRIPNKWEFVHYPLLVAGFLACFFTALNLLPIGQLDGGHVIFGLFGEKYARTIAFWAFSLFVFYGGLGLFSMQDTDGFETAIWAAVYLFFLNSAFSRAIPEMHDRLPFIAALFTVQFFFKSFFPMINGYQGWLLMGYLLGRFMGVYHPPVLDDRPLSRGRKILGWIALVVFVLCVSPNPISMD